MVRDSTRYAARSPLRLRVARVVPIYTHIYTYNNNVLWWMCVCVCVVYIEGRQADNVFSFTHTHTPKEPPDRPPHCWQICSGYLRLVCEFFVLFFYKPIRPSFVLICASSFFSTSFFFLLISPTWYPNFIHAMCPPPHAAAF